MSYPPPPVHPVKTKGTISPLKVILIGVVATVVLCCGGAGFIGILMTALDEDGDDSERRSTGDRNSSPSSAPDTQPTGDARIWPGNERPLREFRQFDTYGWRVNLVDNLDKFEAGLDTVKWTSKLTERDTSIYTHAISTCSDLDKGLADDVVLERATIRFSYSQDDPAPAPTISRLVQISVANACPRLAR